MQQYNLRNSDVVSGALIAALGVYVVFQAREWPYSTPDGPGPGFFPVWYGVLMIGLSLWLIISTALKPKPATEPKDWTGTKRAMISLIAFAVCAAAMSVLGFSVSFSLFTFFLVAYVFQRSLLTAAVTGIAAAAAFHVVFPVLLSVPLPTGWVGF